MASVLVVQHFPADALWSIAETLASADVYADIHDTQQNNALPNSLDGYDGLIVLGGPASAADSGSGYPTLTREIELFQQAHDADIPALGVCLGAQVLARACGGTVMQGLRGKEIGWCEIQLTANGQSILDHDSASMTVLQWHGDTYELPDNIEILADSAKYPKQMFQWGSCTGLQPHMEVLTADGVDAFIGAFPDEAELAEGGADEIRRQTPDAIRNLQTPAMQFFSRWTQRLQTVNAIR